MTFLETKRLILRNLTLPDMEPMYAYRNDAACAKYQRWDDTSKEAVKGLIEAHGADAFLSEKEEQHYAISSHTGELLGDLTYFFTEEENCITLGITISPANQGNGFASEILSGVIGCIREKYPSLDIVALIDRENEKSIRLFEKLGFEKECYAESIASFVYTLFGK